MGCPEMGDVVRLALREGMRMNGRRLALLLRDRGHAATEALLQREAMAALVGTSRLEAAWRRGAMSALAQEAALLTARADVAGLAGIARVTRDVALCADRADPVAFTATLARLRRLARQACRLMRRQGGARA